MSRRALRGRTAGRGAFTVVELMVLASIVAVLAGLLFPVVGAACAVADRVACASNLKQIGLAVITYANQHGGMYPTAEDTWGKDGPGNWWENPDFLMLLAVEPGCRQPSVLTCPADPQPDVFRDGRPKPLCSSYAANTSCFGARRGGSKAARPGALIKQPSQTLAFCDAATSSDAPLVVGHQGCVRGGIAFRHEGCAQGVFLDGHVDALSPADVPLGRDAWREPLWGADPQLWKAP